MSLDFGASRTILVLQELKATDFVCFFTFSEINLCISYLAIFLLYRVYRDEMDHRRGFFKITKTPKNIFEN